MKTAQMTNDRVKELAVKSLLSKYLIKKDNILLSERLFTAKSFINWIFDNIKTDAVKKVYLEDVEKYLKGDMDMKWLNGLIVKSKSTKKEEKNDNKKTETKKN